MRDHFLLWLENTAFGFLQQDKNVSSSQWEFSWVEGCDLSSRKLAEDWSNKAPQVWSGAQWNNKHVAYCKPSCQSDHWFKLRLLVVMQEGVRLNVEMKSFLLPWSTSEYLECINSHSTKRNFFSAYKPLVIQQQTETWCFHKWEFEALDDWTKARKPVLPDWAD